jgi:starvation-inducible outer membrane lipoprotein
VSAGQHTPGPWEHRGFDVWEPGKTALSIGSANRPHPEAHANARLIAAAPDMLEALRRIVEETYITSHGAIIGLERGHFEQARAAIAKATTP